LLETFVFPQAQESLYMHWPFNMLLGGLLLPLMCVIPGLAVLVKRWGWRVGLLIAIIYVPVMTFAVLVFAVMLDGGI
jgi:hypothetical protein